MMEYHYWPLIFQSIVCNIVISLHNKNINRLVTIMHIAIISNPFGCVPKFNLSISKPIVDHHII
jgi:hypothetical protein